jgi:H+/gluconate symporter-like permease
MLQVATVIGLLLLMAPYAIGARRKGKIWSSAAIGSVVTGLAWGTTANIAYTQSRGDMGGMLRAVQTVFMFGAGLLVGAIVAGFAAYIADSGGNRDV